MRGLLSDALGLVGFGLVCTGVYMLWGAGWTCVAAGAPLVVIYIARELGLARRMRRG